MNEKTKRKEKPKRSNHLFVWLSVLLLLVLLGGIAGILGYVFREISCPGSLECPKNYTEEVILTQNSINLTLISASATAEIVNATATEATALNSNLGTLTIEDVQLTATAVVDWYPVDMTARAFMSQTSTSENSE